MRIRAVVAAAGVALLSVTLVDAASAACTRLAFSVNDYGKDGPTKDAKALLDKYIAKWTAERGIKAYKTGPKDVTCELFLNFIVFDEHTCKATANVCWSGSAPSEPKARDAKAPAAPAAAKKVMKKAAATPKATSPITTGSVKIKPKAPTAATKAAAGTPAPVSASAPAAAAVPSKPSP